MLTWYMLVDRYCALLITTICDRMYLALNLKGKGEGLTLITLFSICYSWHLIMAPSDTPSELVAKGGDSHRRWYPYILNSNNIPAFLQTPYMHTLSSGNLQQKRKKAREATSIGGSTAFARTLIMQSLYLFYRTPIKVRVKRVLI